MDKPFFQSIKDAKFAVPGGHSAGALLPHLLPCLGSTDPELRDLLAYEIVATWIQAGYFSTAELHEINRFCTSGLKHGLGETETDTVFLRAFSVLILGELVVRDSKEPCLPDGDLQRILSDALHYLEAEQDLRGKVPEKGWAHTPAHTADLLLALAAHPGIGELDLQRILTGIAAKVGAPTAYPFVASEEQRLGRAVVAVLKRNLVDSAWLKGWVQSIGGSLPWQPKLWHGMGEPRYHNAQAFMLAVFVMLSVQEEPPAELLAELRAALKSFAPWF